jgi:hypothetical protein
MDERDGTKRSSSGGPEDPCGGTDAENPAKQVTGAPQPHRLNVDELRRAAPAQAAELTRARSLIADFANQASAANRFQAQLEEIRRTTVMATSWEATSRQALRDIAASFEASTLKAQIESLRLSKLTFDLPKMPDLAAFRMPDLQELMGARSKIFDDMEQLATRSSTALRLPQIDDAASRWQAEIEKLSASFVKLTEPKASIQAFAALQGIGVTLTTFDGYSPEVSESLRGALGDWRGPVPDVGPKIIDPGVRTELYLAQGFDRRLTDFPEETLGAGLRSAGLAEIDYVSDISLSSFVPSGASREEQLLLRRNSIGYQTICVLERRLRRFMAERMEAAHGPGWEKQRLAPNVYNDWTSKSEKAAASGRPAGPLIDYADFTHYAGVINSNFRTVFGAVFRDAVFVQETFARLGPLRVTVGHSRELTPEDLLYLMAEAQRLLAAVDRAPPLRS